MPVYRPRTSAPLEAFLWHGDNFAEAQEYLSDRVFSVEKNFEPPETLTVVDASGSTRWFVRPGTYVFAKENTLHTAPREEFEALYEEVS